MHARTRYNEYQTNQARNVGTLPHHRDADTLHYTQRHFLFFFFLFKSLSPENQTHTHVSRFEILEKSSVSHLKRVLENILQMTDRYRYEVERTIIFISLFRTD